MKLFDPVAAGLVRLLLHLTDAVRLRADEADPERDRGDVPGWVMITLMTAIVVIGLLAIFQDQVIAAVRAAFSSITGTPDLVAAPTSVRRRQDGSDAAPDRDRGSAVAEFAMVVGLLMLLFLALLQVCLWAYARTIVSAAAADAARYAAVSGAADVTQRVSDRLGDGIGTGMKSSLSCTSAAGTTSVQVHCTMEAPGLVGLLDGVLPTLEVTSHAALEPT